MATIRDLWKLPVSDEKVCSQISHDYIQLLVTRFMLEAGQLGSDEKDHRLCRDKMAKAITQILYLDRGTRFYEKEVAYAEEAKELLRTLQRVPLVAPNTLSSHLPSYFPPAPPPSPSGSSPASVSSLFTPSLSPVPVSPASSTPSTPSTPSARFATPTAPTGPTAVRSNRRDNTREEKLRGQRLNDDKVGVSALTLCKNCAKLHENYAKNPTGRAPPRPCRVPLNPVEFNGVKCGNCIASKRKCCFKWDNPGIPYPPAVLEHLQAMEEPKRLGRDKALQTMKGRPTINRKRKRRQVEEEVACSHQ
ncbi:hypothetical protein HD806DRAFT_60552 [Xylariaceae sp. AK1471]|nr:hypothetical protein HD806DRAFT_60552 [Xylariaceae sp. AK1471]